MKSLEEVLYDWEPLIGLEVHTELTTLTTKMFCSCRISHDAAPNTHVCPVCLGLPGALPVPNAQAIESIVMAGLATDCEIMRHSMLYRKHYFYPDMAKNFQTTQGSIAFCMHGHLNLEVIGNSAKERVGWEADVADRRRPVMLSVNGGYITPIRIQRIHMEEDAAKMVHVGGTEGRITEARESLIDYNRCGTALIELVSEPDLRTPEEARLFMGKLRQIFLALGISNCSLEAGAMRCDGNISLRRRGEQHSGVKTELKNLNSLKSLHDGLAYEICRQADVLEAGETIHQETRHWEPSHHRTVVMRRKETVDDYRFFPDLDLAPFELTDAFIERCRARMPELPDARCRRYMTNFHLRYADASQLAADPTVAEMFERAVDAAGERIISAGKHVTLAGERIESAGERITSAGERIAQTIAHVCINLVPSCGAVSPQQLAGVSWLLAEEAITFAQARELLSMVSGTKKDPEQVVDAYGMRQVTDVAQLTAVVDEVLSDCDAQIQQYRDGNKKVVGYLVGQCMKHVQGAGNPKLFKKLLLDKLDSWGDDSHHQHQ